MLLQQKQAKFTMMTGQLIAYAYQLGFELTYGDAYRDAGLAQWYDRQHLGIERSLHTIRLAVDFNLFIGGEYQSDTKAYLPLGEYWESIGGSWGGRFTRPDGNHFSLEHEGVR